MIFSVNVIGYKTIQTIVLMYLKIGLMFINLAVFILLQSKYHTIVISFATYMIGTQVGAVSHPLASMPPAVKISSAPQVGGQTPIQSSPSLSLPLALQRVASWQPLASTPYVHAISSAWQFAGQTE